MDSKFYFNLKEAAIFQAVKWSSIPLLGWLGFFIKIFFILFLLAAALFLYGFFSQSFSQESNSVLFGLSLIFLFFSLGPRLARAFFNNKLKNPAVTETENLAEFLSFETARAVHKAGKNLNSTNVLYYLLADNPDLNFIFSRLLLNLKEIRKQIRENLPSRSDKQNLYRIIFEARETAQKNSHQRIEMGDMVSVLAKHDPVFKKILVAEKIRIRDMESLMWWLDSLKKKIEKRKRWWDYDNLMKKGTLAKEWKSGYTLTLDRYSTDWTEIARRQGFPEVIGHKSEIEQAERILARREYNNVLLVGEPGIGRKAIVQGLVGKSVLGQSLPDVNYKRVVELDLPGLLAKIADPREIERSLDKVFQEAVSAGNVILVINEFHNFVGVKPGPGKIDISGVISSYLHLPQFQIVAVTSFAGLHRNIEQIPSILNLFEKVEVSEISEKELMMILENFALALEVKYKLFVSYSALREIVSLSRRFLPSLPFPKKALDLLDEVMIYVKRSKEKVVLPRQVAKIVSEKTQVPVGEMEAKEKETLLNLEKLIHQRIINQQEAVREVSTALRRARAEVAEKKGPMGTFLFLGPTGVGKTETAKALAETYFGSESRMIRLDMSEFQDVKDVARLIGSAGQEGLLTTQVAENPFSLILLDEIEKAHPNILNLFLQVLDEGHLTDGLGRKVDFKNAIIIATSNAGYRIILKALREKSDWSQVKQKLLDHLFEKAIYRPEFINRFDAVVVFKPLSKENLLDIAELMLQKLKRNLSEKGIELAITLSLKEKIVELGYDPTFGARQMKRVIQDKVENVLAQAILAGDLKRGDGVEVEPVGFGLKIK